VKVSPTSGLITGAPRTRVVPDPVAEESAQSGSPLLVVKRNNVWINGRRESQRFFRPLPDFLKLPGLVFLESFQHLVLVGADVEIVRGIDVQPFTIHGSSMRGSYLRRILPVKNDLQLYHLYMLLTDEAHEEDLTDGAHTTMLFGHIQITIARRILSARGTSETVLSAHPLENAKVYAGDEIIHGAYN
jgi:hypothetical protein